jgi:hypothetical protein
MIGSSHCFIDSHYAKVNHFPIVSIPWMRLCLINRSSPSYITHATNISVQFPCGTTHQVRFLITKLDTKFAVVLGLDWPTLYNLLVNWADSSVTFRDHPDTLSVITVTNNTSLLFFFDMHLPYAFHFYLSEHEFTCRST